MQLLRDKLKEVEGKAGELADIVLHPPFKSKVLQEEHLLEKARALESCLESGRQAALGGKAE